MLFLCGGTNKCSFRKQRLIDYCNIGICADRSQYSLDVPYGSISADSIRTGRLLRTLTSVTHSRKETLVYICVHRIITTLPGYSALVSDTLRYVHRLI